MKEKRAKTFKLSDSLVYKKAQEVESWNLSLKEIRVALLLHQRDKLYALFLSFLDFSFVQKRVEVQFLL